MATMSGLLPFYLWLGQGLLVTVWAQERCRISPPHFLAECRKRFLSEGSCVLLFFNCFLFWIVFLVSVFWICLLSCIFQCVPTWMALCWCAIKSLLTQLVTVQWFGSTLWPYFSNRNFCIGLCWTLYETVWLVCLSRMCWMRFAKLNCA